MCLCGLWPSFLERGYSPSPIWCGLFLVHAFLDYVFTRVVLVGHMALCFFVAFVLETGEGFEGRWSGCIHLGCMFLVGPMGRYLLQLF